MLEIIFKIVVVLAVAYGLYAVIKDIIDDYKNHW